MKTRRIRRRTVQITSERQQIWTAAPAGHVLAWCPACAQMATWVSPRPWLEDASADAPSSAADLAARFPALHLREAADGSLLICRNSLARIRPDS